MVETKRSSTLEYMSKLAKLGSVAQAKGVNVVVLRSQASLSWLLGARSHVPYTLDRTWFDVVADFSGDQPQVTVVVNTIEAQRLKDTELADYTLEWKIVGWWENRADALPRGESVGSDVPLAGMVDLSGPIATLRRLLTEDQTAELAHICHDSALVATAMAGQILPEMTETRVAGMISAALLDRGMDPVVVLVAGGDRVRNHRHPLPTDRKLGDRATLVFCGRKNGLISAVTRIVSFRPLSVKDRQTYSRLLEVEADFLDATIPGRSIGEAFEQGISGYERFGFDPLEWHRHHQGGFTGWESREYPAHSGSSDLIVEGSVVAWNPSAQGWKVEDTATVTSMGPQVLVHDGVWPMVTVRGRQRPKVLEL